MPKKSNNRIHYRLHDVTIPTADGNSVAERVQISVPMEWDDELGGWLMTAEGEALIENTKARYMGLLMPDELLELRRRLGMSQQGMGDMLKIGAKSWTRWETGKQRPSHSLNLILRLLHAGLISPQQIIEVGERKRDWSAQFRIMAESSKAPEPVALDLCREQTNPKTGKSCAPFEPLRMPA